MDRRTFLQSVSAALIADPLLRKAASARDISDSPPAKPYGSGNFGQWMTDAFCLPAYRYSCDQTCEQRAITPVHPIWRGPTDHTHQVGNGRILAAVSNFGYLQVRQDEGSPKYLNDYHPPISAYGGGLGFLTGPNESLVTFYTGRPKEPESFERIFGAGYFEKIVRGRYSVIDQVIFAPFGDDPVLISSATITNRSARPAELRWVEYWGCQQYQFSYRAWMEAAVQPARGNAAELRRALAARFMHNFTLLPGNTGMIDRQTFQGRADDEEKIWQLVQDSMRDHPEGSFGRLMAPASARAAMEDLAPPAAFLVRLPQVADGGTLAYKYTNDAVSLFGAGGPGRPDGLHQPLPNRLDVTPAAPAFLLEDSFQLEPGESRTLSYLYGYLPTGFDLDDLRAKYAGSPIDHWRRSSAQWKADGLRFSSPSEPWVERELTWSNYYLRSGATFDGFYGEHILSQGQVYEYILGWQAAARDPLQHALPFLFSDPTMVKGVLRYTFEEMLERGTIPYGNVGAGVPMPTSFDPSDQELWLLWVASEYVLATRDKAFLRQIIIVPDAAPDGATPHATVAQLLSRSMDRVVNHIGTGQHGLMRLLNGDWNDDIVVGHVPSERATEIRDQGESVLNAAMAAYVLKRYGSVLQFTDQPSAAATANRYAESQRTAVQACWTGSWFRRAWLGPHLGWVGEDHLWLEPQPWAMLANALSTAQKTTLIGVLNGLLRNPSPIGAVMQSAEDPAMKTPYGTMTNGGVWSSLNGGLINALARVDGAAAWDEWKKNSLARHAEMYPDIWYGIWSGPDNYSSVRSRHPGQTMFAEEPTEGMKTQSDWGFNWTDFPVMNLHAHAWPLYSAAMLLGLKFGEEGFVIRPDLPLETYAFTSPLLGFSKSAKGYEGWYSPAIAGSWKIKLQLSSADSERFPRLTINGVLSECNRRSHSITFVGESTPEARLHWTLTNARP